MDKLNRSVWAAGLCFTSHGVRVGVRVNRVEALELLLPFLPPRWRPTANPLVDEIFSFVLGGAGPQSNVRKYHVVYRNASRMSRTLDLPEATQDLESEIAYYVAEFARPKVFVHAGVVGWRGRAIVVPGRSFAGKSSLVAALVRVGATFYSDEYAVLDPAGRVHPYARRLSIRQGAGERPRRCTAEELGGHSGTAPLPVALVLDTTFRAGVKWRPRRLTAGQGMFSLLANTVPARRRPKAVLRALRAVTERAIVLKGARGDAEEVAGRILKKLDEVIAKA